MTSRRAEPTIGGRRAARAGGETPGRTAPGETAPAGEGRWYTHGWNRGISWRLIRTIIPRIPRPLRLPLHAAATAICYAAMPRERQSARRNLERITGRRGFASRWLAFRLFYNFSKFMVGYTDLMPFRPEALRRFVEGGEATGAAVAGALAGGRGLVVCTLHLGHWEMGLAFMSLLDTPIRVVMRPEESEAARLQDEARHRPGTTTVTAGDSEWTGLELLLALRRGEIIAIQGDRVFGGAAIPVALFGASFRLPGGPFRLAQACGAPILLVAMPIVGHWRYRFVVEGPLRVGPGEDGLRAAAVDFARRVERVVARYPTQWFNFYDLWPEGAPEDPPDGLRPAPRAGA